MQNSKQNQPQKKQLIQPATNNNEFRRSRRAIFKQQLWQRVIFQNSAKPKSNTGGGSVSED
jgi:hypothetical protein